MPFSVALTGNDTIIIFGRLLANFGKGDVVKLEFPNDLVKVEQGKNGNVIYTTDNSGRTAKGSIKVLRGSPDDVFLSGIVAAIEGDLPSFVLGSGTFVKRVGQGDGTVVNDTYALSGVVIHKKPGATDNSDGDPEQAQTMYDITAGSAPRSQL